jgi:hypothetical protein
VTYIADPIPILKQYLKSRRVVDKERELWFEYGCLAMALQVVTWIKTLEELPITTDVGRQETITALHTMLTELGIADEAYEWYDFLSQWRQLSFERAPAL